VILQLLKKNNRCTQQSFLISAAYNYFVVELDYKERLRVRRESIIPKNQVMLNSVISVAISNNPFLSTSLRTGTNKPFLVFTATPM